MMSKQGHHEKALAYHELCIDMKVKLLGESDPSLATSYSNFAVTLNALGQCSRALPLLHRALQIRTISLGERHEMTRRTKAWIALCNKD